MARTITTAEARRHFTRDEGWTPEEFEALAQYVAPDLPLTAAGWEWAAMELNARENNR